MKVLIIGCGRVGSGLAKNLLLHGVDVAIVDKDLAALQTVGPSLKGKTFNGLGFDKEVLEAAGIEKCDALAAVTGSDEANLVIARVAKTFYHVPRVSARVYEPQKAKIYRRMGIQTISPVTLGIERLISTLIYSEMQVERAIGAGQVALVDVDVAPQMVGKGVKDINIPGEIQVSALTRNGKTFLPDQATSFQRGDIVHLLCITGSKDKVAKAFAQ
ncbi:MAG: TrkA family potassium uptake protein [Anaerolineaceae bacterium]|nr:TrkA family potassium uptake protein [Anaerolineaceae bacterium]